MKEENRLWISTARKLTGETSKTELEELEALLKKDHDAGYYMKIIQLGGKWLNVVAARMQRKFSKGFLTG
jgi:hypothetical protein